MKKTALLIMGISLALTGFCQNDSTSLSKKKKSFNANVIMMDGKIYYGKIDSVNAEGIGFTSKNSSQTQFFIPDQITSIDIKRKGSVPRGILIGALSGAFVGAAIGLISGDDPPCHESQGDFFGLGYAFCDAFRQTASQKAAVGAAGLGLGGAIVGGIIGAVAKKKFIIKGSREKWKEQHTSLMKKLGIQ